MEHAGLRCVINLNLLDSFALGQSLLVPLLFFHRIVALNKSFEWIRRMPCMIFIELGHFIVE